MLHRVLLIDIVGDRVDLVLAEVNANQLATIPPVFAGHRVINEVAELYWVLIEILILNDEDATLFGSFEGIDETFLGDGATTTASSSSSASCWHCHFKVISPRTHNEVTVILVLLEERRILLEPAHFDL